MLIPCNVDRHNLKCHTAEVCSSYFVVLFLQSLFNPNAYPERRIHKTGFMSDDNLPTTVHFLCKNIFRVVYFVVIQRFLLSIWKYQIWIYQRFCIENHLFHVLYKWAILCRLNKSKWCTFFERSFLFAKMSTWTPTKVDGYKHTCMLY